MATATPVTASAAPVQATTARSAGGPGVFGTGDKNTVLGDKTGDIGPATPTALGIPAADCTGDNPKFMDTGI